jgi:hypothetical protein
MENVWSYLNNISKGYSIFSLLNPFPKFITIKVMNQKRESRAKIENSCSDILERTIGFSSQPRTRNTNYSNLNSAPFNPWMPLKFDELLNQQRLQHLINDFTWNEILNDNENERNIQIFISHFERTFIRRVKTGTKIFEFFKRLIKYTTSFFLTIKGRIILKCEKFEEEHKNQLFCVSIWRYGGSKFLVNDGNIKFSYEVKKQYISNIQRNNKLASLQIVTKKGEEIIIDSTKEIC